MIKRTLFFLFLFFLVINTARVESLITGYATSQSASITVNVVAGAPSISIIKPYNGTYFTNQSIPLEYLASGHQFVWYNLNKGSNITLQGNRFLNVSQGQNTLYLYANNSDGTLVSATRDFSVNSTIFTINFTKFQEQGLTNSTDFTKYTKEELGNLTGITFEYENYGILRFNDAVNVTNDLDPTDNYVNLNEYLNVSHNRIELNSTGLPNFNVSATLILRNLSFTNPRILRDGSACSSVICTITGYSSGTLTFDVTKFSTYSAEQTPNTDTGGSSGGGGGGGGGGGTRTTESFDVEPNQDSIKIKQGETKITKITITNKLNSELTISLEPEGIDNLVKIEENTITLKPKEKREITIDIIARENTEPRTHLGKIIVTSDYEEKEILMAIDVSSKQPLFDVSAEIAEKTLYIQPGETLLAIVKLFNLGSIGRVDAHITYEVFDKDNNRIIIQEEDVAVETQLSFIREIILPTELEEGTYTLAIQAEYGELFASGSTFFFVTNKDYSQVHGLMVIGIVALLLMAIIGIIVMLLYLIRRKT